MKDSAPPPADTERTDPVDKEPALPRNGEDKLASPQTKSEKARKPGRRRVLSAIGVQVVLLACMALLSWLAALAHGYDWPIPSAEDFASFDFIGVGPDNPEPSFLAVAIEVLAWSAFGVLARSQYYVTRLITDHEDFSTLEIISVLIGNFARAIAMATAVVALLRSTEFVTLSLKTAGIDVIAAISFILGFFHEHTFELLEGFRARLATDTSEPPKNGDTA